MGRDPWVAIALRAGAADDNRSVRPDGGKTQSVEPSCERIERSVIREHVPPDADGDDRDDQAERKPELTAGQPPTEGGAELSAWHRADRHDERGFVRDLIGDELPHDAHARGKRCDGERAADRHANRHTDDDQQQRDEQERAAGADQSRADADASAHRCRERAAEASRLTDGQGRRRRLDGHDHERAGGGHHEREDQQQPAVVHVVGPERSHQRARRHRNAAHPRQLGVDGAVSTMGKHARRRRDQHLHHRDAGHGLHAQLADVDERRHVQQQRNHDDGAADTEEPGHEGTAEAQAHQRGGERQSHVADARRDRWRSRLTTGHSTITTEMASSAALTGRVTKTLTSLAWATIDVRKYCSAIGPRMMPITSGGMGKSYRRMKKPRTPKSIVSQTSARSLRSANAPRKQKTTMKVLRIGGGALISMAKESAAREPSPIMTTLARIIPATIV